jgi:hypothetical protein
MTSELGKLCTKYILQKCLDALNSDLTIEQMKGGIKCLN